MSTLLGAAAAAAAAETGERRRAEIVYYTVISLTLATGTDRPASQPSGWLADTVADSEVLRR